MTARTLTCMPRLRPTSCTDCNRGQAIAGQISWGGLCADCAASRVAAAVAGMGTKAGPAYQRWLASNGPRGRPPRGKGVPPG